MDHIVTYVKPNTDQKSDWDSLPDDVKNTFDRLGIPEAERSYLAGVGAQYDSELVYHNMQDTASRMGIVYSGIEEALHDPKWEELIHDKFMTLIPPTDHKFAALHGAVWSGGSFVYVPKDTKLDFPLQSYFRLNAKGAGQFEHTLIIVEDGADLHFIEGCSAPKYNVANLHAGAVELFVGKNAKLRYSTIENWSKNMYNLNTKRAVCDEGGQIEWVSGSFGSHVGYLYPMSILKGRKSRCTFTGITFAGTGQNLDTGCKVVLAAPETTAAIETKSISKGGGVSTFRSSVVATPRRGELGRERVVPVAYAGRPQPLRHHPRDGHPLQARRRGTRGDHRPHRRRQGVLPDEPRHSRGRGAHDDRERLRRPGLEGAAPRIRRGNEQPHQA